MTESTDDQDSKARPDGATLNAEVMWRMAAEFRHGAVAGQDAPGDVLDLTMLMAAIVGTSRCDDVGEAIKMPRAMAAVLECADADVLAEISEPPTHNGGGA